MSGLLEPLAGLEVVMPLNLTSVRSNKGKGVAVSAGGRNGRHILGFHAFFQGFGVFPG
jgi:hypothetical protein